MDHLEGGNSQSKSQRNRRPPRRKNDGVKANDHEEKKHHQDSQVINAFLQFQKELDHKYDKRERIIKLSRDTTICSKRVIFILHRASDSERLPECLKEVDSKLEEVRGYLAKVAQELEGEDCYKFARAYSGGLQEFVEAVTFLHFIKERKLLCYRDLCEKYLSFKTTDNSDPSNGYHAVLLTQVDYILGVADLTGELMRMCMNQISSGNQNRVMEICRFLRTLHDQFLMLSGIKDLKQKMNVLRKSLQKVENACYTLTMRGSEVPQHMLVDLIQMRTDPGMEWSDD